MGCKSSRQLPHQYRDEKQQPQKQPQRPLEYQFASSFVSSVMSSALHELSKTASVENRSNDEADQTTAIQRKYSVGVAAVAPDDWIRLNAEDNKRINEIHKLHPDFSKYELQCVFAAVKENGGSLQREEFAMVYATYAKIADHALALRVCDLFDRNGDGKISFEELVPFLDVMVHGTIQSKAKYCFQLYGSLVESDVANLLLKMPTENTIGQGEHDLLNSRSLSDRTNLPGLAEEVFLFGQRYIQLWLLSSQMFVLKDDETEAAEQEVSRKLKEKMNQNNTHLEKSQAALSSARLANREEKTKQVASEIFQSLGQENTRISLEVNCDY